MESGREILGTSKKSRGGNANGQAKKLVRQNCSGTRKGNSAVNLKQDSPQNIAWVQLDQKQLRTLVKMSAMSRRWLKNCQDNDPTVAATAERDIAEINSIDEILIDCLALERVDEDYGFMSN